MTEKELILRIYGDSRCKPSYKRETPIQDVWEEQLKNLIESKGTKVYLYDKSFGGKNIEYLYDVLCNDRTYWGDAKGIVIIFIGIVDCAPRPIHPILRSIISKLNKNIRIKIVDFIHNHRTQMLKIKYYQNTKIKPFKKLYSKMIKRTIENNEVFCVGIGPLSQELKERAWGIQKEIKKYNKTIASLTQKYENCHYVDLPTLLSQKMEENNNNDDEIFVGDGHHFTPLGHKYISEIMYNIFSEILKL